MGEVEAKRFQPLSHFGTGGFLNMTELRDCRVERVTVYDVCYDDGMAEEVHGFYEQPDATVCRSRTS